jgi:hypothetical protein
MKWRVEIAPQVERDVTEAAEWYEGRHPGLGSRFPTSPNDHPTTGSQSPRFTDRTKNVVQSLQNEFHTESRLFRYELNMF